MSFLCVVKAASGHCVCVCNSATEAAILSCFVCKRWNRGLYCACVCVVKRQTKVGKRSVCLCVTLCVTTQQSSVGERRSGGGVRENSFKAK